MNRYLVRGHKNEIGMHTIIMAVLTSGKETLTYEERGHKTSGSNWSRARLEQDQQSPALIPC